MYSWGLFEDGNYSFLDFSCSLNSPYNPKTKLFPPITPHAPQHLQSMGSTQADPAAAILPIDLGAASAFDQLIFPLAYYVPADDISKGSVLIKATLEEMDKIRQLGIDLNENANFIFNTRLTLEASVPIHGIRCHYVHVIVV